MTEPKKLPERTNYRKSEIKEYLKGINIHKLSAFMNETIAKQRKIPIELAKNEKCVFPSEVKIILEYYE